MVFNRFSAACISVSIFGVSGAQVAGGYTNEAITVNGTGIFVVRANGQSVKIVK